MGRGPNGPDIRGHGTMRQHKAGYHNGKCFYGSSTYDTAQMPRLIDLLIGECREQGIETKRPAELAALMEEWENGER